MSYTSIAEVGELIVSVLREALVPDLVMNENLIALASPDQRDELAVTVYLYDINECREVGNGGMRSIGDGKLAYPKSYLTLHYMITAYSDSDIKFKAVQEQKILGKIYQVLRDLPTIPISRIKNTIDTVDYGIKVFCEDIPMEQKMRLWPANNKAYKTSLFFCANPVGVDTTKTRDIKRVLEVDYSMIDKNVESTPKVGSSFVITKPIWEAPEEIREEIEKEQAEAKKKAEEKSEEESKGKSE